MASSFVALPPRDPPPSGTILSVQLRSTGLRKLCDEDQGGRVVHGWRWGPWWSSGSTPLRKWATRGRIFCDVSDQETDIPGGGSLSATDCALCQRWIVDPDDLTTTANIALPALNVYELDCPRCQRDELNRTSIGSKAIASGNMGEQNVWSRDMGADGSLLPAHSR